MDTIIAQNSYWDSAVVRVSVIIPVYNRRNTIRRTLASLERQVYRNFECIIVNDGSTVNIDDIIKDFMDNTEIPVLYIKKENGGVHTARNRGTLEARGEILTGLDSDDEFTDDALETVIAAWDSIPDKEKSLYREVVAKCMDAEGHKIGAAFPDDINYLPSDKAEKILTKIKGDHAGFDVSKIRKENLWPEPEGITFVTEDILWKKLGQKYRSWYINNAVKIIHMDGESSLSRTKIWTVQSCKNIRWNYSYMLNHSGIYLGSKYNKWFMIPRFCVFGHVLHFHGQKDTVYLEKKSDRLIEKILYLPSYIVAQIYVKKRM